MVPHQDQFISVFGHSLFVRFWAADNNAKQEDLTPILLIHDSLGCVETWGDFPALLSLATKRKVIAYDRLGFGQSEARIELPLPDFIEEEGSRFLPEILNQLKLDKVILFGHSVGGAMAISAARQLAGKIQAVISESAQAFVEDRTINGIRAGKQFFQTEKGISWLQRFHGNKKDWVLNSWTEVWLSEAFQSWSLSNDEQPVSCPTLILHGDQDEYGSIAFPEALKQLVSAPATAVILPNCGHIPHKEMPEVILNQVGQFLSNQP
ncbi:alpha/beta hydrolase [bacterium SCSIO 12741]|nr:alpha/beta hydrolase [bacterium SCSIO 12741]